MSLIEVRNLKKYLKVPTGTNHAVDDASFTTEKGETLGVVGESGCGKSTLGRTLIRLQDATDGQILLNGQGTTKVKGNELKKIREKVQIVFQDPCSSLNPRTRIESTIMEPLKHSGLYKTKNELKGQTKRLTGLVGIDEGLSQSYLHELDGGRRQRVGTARTSALNPEFIICDEPVFALDAPIQAWVLNPPMDLQGKTGIAYMFVTYDLSVIRHISNSICVTYLRQMAEKASTEDLFKHMLHSYIKAFLSAIPSTDIYQPMQRVELKGETTSPTNPKPGCRLVLRRPYATEAYPQPQKSEETEPHHFVACCRVRELN